MRVFLYLMLFCLYSFCAVSAQNVLVVDGDSIKIGNKRIRLEGIDAPEYNQTCYYYNKKKYNCGKKAKKYLQSLVNQGRVTCIEKDVDIYKRSLSSCYVTNSINNKININEQMVKSGWALVYKNKFSDYSSAQDYAKKSRLGVWKGKFMKPQLYRLLNNN